MTGEQRPCCRLLFEKAHFKGGMRGEEAHCLTSLRHAGLEYKPQVDPHTLKDEGTDEGKNHPAGDNSSNAIASRHPSNRE